MSSIREFKIPEGPPPMPTMDSEDEESFVVLGQSLMPDVDLSFKNLSVEKIEIQPIEEAKKLINMKLAQFETSGIIKGPTQPEMSRARDSALSLPSTSLSSNLYPAEIQEKIEMLIDENVKLRDIINKNNAAIEVQHEKILAWKEEVHDTHKLHKEKFAEAKKCITTLVQEKAQLANELEKNKEIRQLQEVELFRLKEEIKNKCQQINSQIEPGFSAVCDKEKHLLEVDTLKKDLVEALRKRNDVEEFLKIVFAQKDRLENEKDEIERNKNKIISDLQKELKKKEDLIEVIRNNLKVKEESSSKEIAALKEEMNNLKSQGRVTVNLKEDLENVRKQLMASQENITHLLQTNSVLEAQLTAEIEKVKELKKLETIRDDYFAVQQQLEVYKNDFEEERRLKETYKAENKQLASDFHQVQKRNGELQDELEVLKERGWELVREDRRTSSTSSASAESPPPLTYECPICFLKYRTLKFLEDHVATCNPEPSWL